MTDTLKHISFESLVSADPRRERYVTVAALGKVERTDQLDHWRYVATVLADPDELRGRLSDLDDYPGSALHGAGVPQVWRDRDGERGYVPSYTYHLARGDLTVEPLGIHYETMPGEVRLEVSQDFVFLYQLVQREGDDATRRAYDDVRQREQDIVVAELHASKPGANLQTLRIRTDYQVQPRPRDQHQRPPAAAREPQPPS